MGRGKGLADCQPAVPAATGHPLQRAQLAAALLPQGTPYRLPAENSWNALRENPHFRKSQNLQAKHPPVLAALLCWGHKVPTCTFSFVNAKLDQKDREGDDLNCLLPTAECLTALFLIQFMREKLFIQITFQTVHKNLLDLNVEMPGSMIANWNIKRLILL